MGGLLRVGGSTRRKEKMMEEPHCCVETVRAEAFFGGCFRRLSQIYCTAQKDDDEKDDLGLTSMTNHMKGCGPTVHPEHQYGVGIKGGSLEANGIKKRLETVVGINMICGQSLCVTYSAKEEKKVRFIVKA